MVNNVQNFKAYNILSYLITEGQKVDFYPDFKYKATETRNLHFYAKPVIYKC